MPGCERYDARSDCNGFNAICLAKSDDIYIINGLSVKSRNIELDPKNYARFQ